VTSSKKRNDNLKTLNLKDDATNEDIKLAYRRLAKKTHLDLNKDDPEASKKFLEVKNAYNDLNSSNKKGIRIRSSNYKEPWTWRSLDSLFKEIINDNFFFEFEKRESNEVPISLLEPFIDLKELVKRKRKNKYF